MRFRWPFVRRRRLDNALAALDGATDYVADRCSEVRALMAELADVERARDVARADVEKFRSIAFHGDATWQQLAQSGRQKCEELTARIGRAVEVLTEDTE